MTSARGGVDFASRASVMLADEVHGRLAILHALATGAPLPREAMACARHELSRRVAAWRALLEAHAPDARGHCARCPRRWLRRTAWPCSVWAAAYDCLITDPAARLP